MLKIYQKPFIQELHNELFLDKGLRVFVKREDVIHPYVSGNKWRKLKYNLEEAKAQGAKSLLTFGGAFSNHIYATAAAAKEAGFKAIGIIRGEELAKQPLNHTLTFSKNKGMELHFVTRDQYRDKTNESFITYLRRVYGDFYLIPEGGTNNLAIKGCEEMLDEATIDFHCICCAVGTGGTISGIIAAAQPHQNIIGFSSLKGDFLTNEVEALVEQYGKVGAKKWQIDTRFHFGGYGKITDALLDFISDFESEYQIPLDPIYTGKMMYGLLKGIENDEFPRNTSILAIHTGGLQGAEGFGG